MSWRALIVAALAIVGCRTPPLDEATVPDASVPADLAFATQPDSAVADLAIPDSAVADLAIPDSAVADLATRDRTVVDFRTIDLAPPPSQANLALGWSYSCARMTDATVRCWGENQYGMLGDGTLTDRHVPTPVVGLTDVAEIGSGIIHVCARRTDGTVYCWGYNQYGYLGNGTMDMSNIPVQVEGITDAIQLAVGDVFNCVIHADHTVSCWGYVQDAIGLTTVPHVFSGLSDVAELRLGWSFGCSRRSNGAVSCWGENLYGEVGVPAGPQGPGLVAPVQVLVGARAISVGAHATLAQLVDGTARSWGWNQGQLGTGAPGSVPQGVFDAPLWAGMDVLVSGPYDACGIRDGGVRCAGVNQRSELGVDAGDPITTPVAVPGLTGASSVALGLYHTCARTHDDEIYCWGQNDHGQLGDGTTADHAQPTLVRW